MAADDFKLYSASDPETELNPDRIEDLRPVYDGGRVVEFAALGKCRVENTWGEVYHTDEGNCSVSIPDVAVLWKRERDARRRDDANLDRVLAVLDRRAAGVLISTDRTLYDSDLVLRLRPVRVGRDKLQFAAEGIDGAMFEPTEVFLAGLHHLADFHGFDMGERDFAAIAQVKLVSARRDP